MRQSRTRRRLKIFLCLLFAVCLILFVEDRIEAFVPDVKNFAEMKVEEALNGRVKFSIGSLEGGILNPITVNDIRIKDSRDMPVLPYLLISSIRTNYRIWNVLFANRNVPMLDNVLAGVNAVDANFSTVNREASGFVRLEKEAGNVKLTGHVNLLYEDRIDFNGLIKDDTFDLEVRPRSGLIKANGRIGDDGVLTVNFKATHLKLGNFDVVCDGVLKNRIAIDPENQANSSMEGELETRNLLLNYKPFLDLKMSYRVSGGTLDIPNLALADIIKGRGKISMSEPYNANFTVTTNNLSLSWLLLGLGAKDAGSILTGTMNSKFDIKGPIANLKSNIQLDIRKGTMAKLEFDYLSAHMKGDGPIIRIEESRITRESGYFALAGEMDLRNMGKNNLFDYIKIASDERAITWDGLDVTKSQGVQEVRMEKKISEDLNIDFKKFVTDNRVDESIRDSDEVQLEYKLHPNDSLKLMVGQEKDFLGIEHKDKF